MQSVPLKVTSKIDITGPLTKWLKKNFGRKIDPALTSSLEKVQKQRDAISAITTYNGLNNISDLKCYLSYLQQLEKVFPVTGPKCIEVPWTWTDSFGRRKTTVYDILYEEAAVMYNIAALYTIAASQQFNVEELTLERITTCIENLRCAALYFRELRNQYSTRLETLKPSEDLKASVLQTLETLCFAEGQYVFYLKAKEKGLPCAAFVILEKRAADLYKGVMECAKKCPRYFPSGLEKHFELECYLLSIETLHYYGMQLMAKPEENSGVLYKLGGMIDDMRVAAEKHLNSFFSEYIDQVQAKNTFDMVKDDSRVFYQQYRIYGGRVPEQPELPNGMDKMSYAENLDITEVPLALPIPENANVLKAMSRYQDLYRKRVDDMQALCKQKNDELNKLMCDYLLPEILTAQGFASGLPDTMMKRLQSVQSSGSLRGLQGMVDKLESTYLDQKDKLDAVRTQVERGSEFTEVIDWMEKSLKNFNSKIADLKKNIGVMSGKAIIFNESSTKLAMSLPACTNYPETQSSVQMKNSSDQASNLLSQRRELLHSLLLDKTGETVVRSRVQADGNLLNIETILYSAITGVDRICQQIKDNCDQQATVVKSLKNEYSKWNKSRKVTSEMKKREDALRDVNANLNLYEESMDLTVALQEASEAIAKCLAEVMEKMGVN